jgi:hypothetical protein
MHLPHFSCVRARLKTWFRTLPLGAGAAGRGAAGGGSAAAARPTDAGGATACRDAPRLSGSSSDDEAEAEAEAARRRAASLMGTSSSLEAAAAAKAARALAAAVSGRRWRRGVRLGRRVAGGLAWGWARERTDLRELAGRRCRRRTRRAEPTRRTR